jgi:hypothetical protein
MGLTIEYIPTGTDLSLTVTKGRGYASYPSHFIALNPGALVHGNSTIAVNNGTEDVSSDYGTWRRMCIWTVPIGDRIPNKGKVDFKWHDDNKSKIPNWTDIPGIIYADGLTGMPAQRNLLEFVVAVEMRPDAGAVYFFVLVSTNGVQYRVEMSDAKAILFADWQKISASPDPWAEKSGCKIAVTSGWLLA